MIAARHQRPLDMTPHLKNEPSILYFGTPVVLISTENADASYNIAPMSSAFWLGWRGILGLAATSKTVENLIRTRQCVLNLPSEDLVGAVNRLARTTGSDPVPEGKLRRGYRFERAKFEIAGLSPVASETIQAPRIAECPVQMEAVVEAIHGVAEADPAQKGRIITIEVRIQRVHLHDHILLDGDPNRVNPDAWRPLIMSFQNFYGLSPRLHPSTLAEIPESMYRGPDIDRARGVAACG
jgi:flavin reductase (DIM6/NTAB) family NADH-FMN oxidoreductase RutF